MSSLLLTAPAVERLSLAEAKVFLRVVNVDDDDVISALIAASRIHIEVPTRRALVTQSWRIALDQWSADGRLAVRPALLQTITAVRAYDFEGAAHAIDLQAFVIDAGNSTAAFAPWTLAQPGRLAAGIEFDVVCGYGDAASDVPEPLRQSAGRALVRESRTRGYVCLERGGLGQGLWARLERRTFRRCRAMGDDCAHRLFRRAKFGQGGEDFGPEIGASSGLGTAHVTRHTPAILMGAILDGHL